MHTPDRIDRMVLKFREVLAATERLGAAGLEAYQHNLLGPLLEHARRNTAFYADRLAPVFPNGRLDLARWNEIPILTRAEAQQQVEALKARHLPPDAGPVSSSESSGSTGRPFLHLKNELVDIASLGMTDRLYRWWGFDGARPMAMFFSRMKDAAPPPDGKSSQGWRSGFPEGTLHMLDMWADTDTQIAWLLARKLSYLMAYPSTILALAERVREDDIDLRFDRVISTAAAVSDEIRDACRNALGCRLIDHYGADEIGHIACECPGCGQYHVGAEGVRVEILDEAGRSCGPGETGRVILTSLYNYAMPFIRYEIGDYATVAKPGRRKCRVALPSLSRVVGRYRNTFTLPDGRIIYPYVQISRFRDFISFSQVQVIQTGYDAIEVRYVKLEPAREPDAAGLGAYLSEALGARFNVQVTAVPEIARSASGKFEDFLSLVPRRRPGLAPQVQDTRW